MPENPHAAIRIGQVNLRIPARGAESAARVASGLGHALQRRTQTGAPRHYGALSVRVHVPANASDAEVIDLVAEAIMRPLRNE
jgi:hypothetical protein